MGIKCKKCTLNINNDLYLPYDFFLGKETHILLQVRSYGICTDLLGHFIIKVCECFKYTATTTTNRTTEQQGVNYLHGVC